MTDIPDKSKSWLTRLKEGLKKSSARLSDNITSIIHKRKLDQSMLDELEDLLIMSDLGVHTTHVIIEAIKKQRFQQDISQQEVKTIIVQEVVKILQPVTQVLNISTHQPFIVLVIGVNGSGKTTTVAKLASMYQNQGHKVMVVACDTFRAAAVDQLKIWAERSQIPCMFAPTDADPASLAFESLQRAHAEQFDVVLIDTAGRLHNNAGLMDELKKIRRVLQKKDAQCPHACLLILDATTGQNAHNQVEKFLAEVNVTGLIMTKLDGTARGGVLVSLAERFKLPIYAIGVGEQSQDLRDFDAQSFAEALVGLSV